MSRSSFGNFRASGTAVQPVPDCSSALGLYVPSVCLFFFTTKKSHARTAKTMARTPRVTVGATIAAMLTPWKWPIKEKKEIIFQYGDNKWFQIWFTGYDLGFSTHICLIRTALVFNNCVIPCKRAETSGRRLSSAADQARAKLIT